jgi:hypothetical protein
VTKCNDTKIFQRVRRTVLPGTITYPQRTGGHGISEQATNCKIYDDRREEVEEKTE